MKKIYFLFLAASVFSDNAFAATITAAVTGGNWSDASTWVGGVVPKAGDNVLIKQGTVVTVDKSTAVCTNITLGVAFGVSDVAVLEFAANSTLTSSGTTNFAYESEVSMTKGGTFISGTWAGTGGVFSYGIGKVIFTGKFTLPSSKGFDEFYDLEIASGSIVTLSGDIVIYNDLAMTSGLCNLNGKVLTLGSSGTASTLTRTTGWMYGGTFKRFWLPSIAISSTDADAYGLFPMGTSAAASYRPVEINSTVSPAAGGFFTVKHVDTTGVLDLNPVYNDAGTDIIRIHNAQFITAISGVTGGTYDIAVTMTGLASGNISDIRLAIFTGGTTASTAGTHVVSTGTAANPTAKRTGITTLTDFNNDFRISTTDAAGTPLVIPLSVQWMDNNSFQNNNIISVYPNPGSEYIQYIVSSKNGDVVTVKVMDALGREVMNAEEVIEAGITTKKLNTSALSSGSYLLRIITGENGQTEKQFMIK